MSKLDTPLTLLARWNQNLAPLSHFLFFLESQVDGPLTLSAFGAKIWHTSHTCSSLESKFGTSSHIFVSLESKVDAPLTLLARWNQSLARLSHFWLFRFKFTLLSHVWLLGIINWRPVTLLALRNRNLTPLSHFWLAGVKIWHPSHTLGSLVSKIGASLTCLALHASLRGWSPWVEDRPPCVYIECDPIVGASGEFRISVLGAKRQAIS